MDNIYGDCGLQRQERAVRWTGNGAMFNVPCCSQRLDLCFGRVFLLVSASPHRGIREQRAMALLGLGRQSARELALDEWAAVAEALRYGWPKVTNHLHTFVISKSALHISSEKPED